jgi:hypothetical protein
MALICQHVPMTSLPSSAVLSDIASRAVIPTST